MGETRSATYDQDLKDKQNAELEAEHESRRARLGQVSQAKLSAAEEPAKKPAKKAAKAPAKKASASKKSA